MFANKSIRNDRARVIDLLNELLVFFPAGKNLACWDDRNKGLLLDILNELEATSDSLAMQEFVDSVRVIKADAQRLPVDQCAALGSRLSYLKLRIRGLRVELSKAICSGPSGKPARVAELAS